MSALDPYVTALYRRSIGYDFDANSIDHVAAFKANPALVEEARSEVERLTGSGPRNLSQANNGCAESKIRHDALVQMLAAYQEHAV